MMFTWDESDVDGAKAQDSNGLDLCWMSLFKVLFIDKGKCGPKGRRFELDCWICWICSNDI